MSLFTKGTSVIGGLAGLGAGIAQGFFGSRRDGMQSPYNVQEISSRLGELNGLYKPSLYVVKIIPQYPNKFWLNDAGVRNQGKSDNKAQLKEAINKPLGLLCNSAALPGAQILTSDHRRTNMGTFDRRPFGIQVTDIPLTFMVDNAGLTMKFFNNWMHNIVHYQTPSDNTSVKSGSDGEIQASEINYRDRYLCTIEIACLTGTDEGQGKGLDRETRAAANELGILRPEVLTYRLYEAFPIQMGDVTVAWAETDSFLSLPVQFTFRRYEVERFSVPNIREPAQREWGWNEILGIISGGAGVIGGLKGASKQSILTNGINLLNGRSVVNRLANF